MPAMTVIPDVEATGHLLIRRLSEALGGPAAVLESDRLIHISTPIEVGGMPHGMQSGRTAVSFCFALPDGRVVLAETSLALFKAAADALAARYGEE